MSRLTPLGKTVLCVLFVVVLCVGYYYAKSHGLFNRSQSLDVGTAAQSDTDAAPAPQQPVQQAPVAPEPASQAEQAPAPAVPAPAPQSQDASSNRGMQFLLNQGKSGS
jgi:hypothetical protein